MRHVRPKYQIFLSSTWRDLHEEREAVTWAILTAGHIPAGMENFTAKDDRGWKTITRVIDQSDYYVLLLAGMYGSVDPESGLSWTEKEYDYALSKGLRVLAFTRERAATPGDKVETDPVKMAKLAAFLKKIRDSHLSADWKDRDDLPGKVTEALRHQIEEDEDEDRARPGWYRGDRVPSASALDEFARLSAETERLREENARLKAELGAKDSGIYPVLKRLIEVEGRKRIIFANDVFLNHPSRELRPPAGHANAMVVQLSETDVRSEGLSHIDWMGGPSARLGEKLPLVIPLSLIEGAYGDPVEPDLLHLRLKANLGLIDGRWTFR